MRLPPPTICVLLLGLTAFGCGGGDFATAEATGVVLCQGQPVPNARVYFEPLQEGQSALVGKPAFAIADETGNFTLTTYKEGDGAVVGKHRVRVDSPHPEDFPEFECDCVTDASQDVMQVELKADELNDFTIELPAKPKTYRPDAEEMEDLEDAREAAAE